MGGHSIQKVPVPAAAKNTHATTQLRHVLAADSLTRHHDRHEPPTASEPQPKTVAVLPTASPHVSLISPLSNQRQSTTTVPQQPQSTTETHDRSSRQQASSPRVHDNNLSEPASAKKGKEKMVVRIRLARFGCKNKPFYRVMAADSRSPRDGKHLEVLGYYNPLPGQDSGKRMGLNFDRVKYWLSVGAQPSDPVQRILFRAGLLPPPPMVAMGRKGGPHDTRPVDPMTGRVLEKPTNAKQIKADGMEGEAAP
ncbi:hypothetical protein CUMW_002390 [Citrus unshiu]|nr:hypothetical protein CUMW_002390 [Citrus unshiu]